MSKIAIILYFIIICFPLNAQHIKKIFQKHLDTTIILNSNHSMNPMPADLRFLDSIDKFIFIAKNNSYQFEELKSALETIIKLSEIRYSLANPLLSIYIKNFQDQSNYLPFILNNAFNIKNVTTDRMGVLLFKEIYLFAEITENCTLNKQIKTEMLKSDFLKEEYRKISVDSYQLFFKNCNEELSVNKMIKKAHSKKKKKALKEIKQMIQQNTKK